MTLEDRRREALQEMRDLLAEGREPAEAAVEIGQAYNFSTQVVLQFSSGMIENLEALKASEAASEARLKHKLEVEGYVQQLKTMLRQDPRVDIASYLHTIPRERLTEEEYQDVYHRCNIAWLEANV